MSVQLRVGIKSHQGWRSYPSTALGMEPVVAGATHGVKRLATDSIGNFTLTLTNLVVGSAIRMETQAAGALIEFRVAAGTSEVFTIPAYSAGNASNDLRIKVRKGSAAPLYKPYETLATASVGAGSVYIAQIPD
jgi:hypothetical protein